MGGLHSLSVFVRVADTGSFVAAGRILGLSASAVGKSVARLENKLGARLFRRNTRSVTLTAEGALFLVRSRRMLAEMTSAELELSQALVAPRGRLRLSLPIVGSLVTPILGEFMRAFPAIELDLDFTDRVVDVIGEGFDAVVRTGHPADSRLHARRLGAFRMVLVASPCYLARQGTPHTVADLLTHSCLRYRYPSNGKLEPWMLHHLAGQSDVQVPRAMVCNNLDTLVCFALKGLGLAYLPDFSVKTHLADGRLNQVMADHVKQIDIAHVLWPASKHPVPKVRALVDFLCARVFPTIQ